MTRGIAALALTALVGCAKTTGSPDTGSTTDTGTPGTGGDMPSYCEEFSRVAVSDPSVAADGFDFAASSATAVQAGSFSGDLVYYAAGGSGDHVPMTLTLTVTGIDAVKTVLVDPNTDTSYPPMGAPDNGDGCLPYYEIRMDAHLATDDGALDEDASVASRASAPDVGAFSASIDLTTIQGTASPSDIDPSEWDAVALVANANLQDGHWAGSLMWAATNEPTPDTSATYDTATGVGTGTVGVSGETSPLGSFDLAPSR